MKAASSRRLITSSKIELEPQKIQTKMLSKSSHFLKLSKKGQTSFQCDKKPAKWLLSLPDFWKIKSYLFFYTQRFFHNNGDESSSANFVYWIRHSPPLKFPNFLGISESYTYQHISFYSFNYDVLLTTQCQRAWKSKAEGSLNLKYPSFVYISSNRFPLCLNSTRSCLRAGDILELCQSVW